MQSIDLKKIGNEIKVRRVKQGNSANSFGGNAGYNADPPEQY